MVPISTTQNAAPTGLIYFSFVFYNHDAATRLILAIFAAVSPAKKTGLQIETWNCRDTAEVYEFKQRVSQAGRLRH